MDPHADRDIGIDTYGYDYDESQDEPPPAEDDDREYDDDDPQSVLLVVILIALALVIGLALTERAGAAPANTQPSSSSDGVKNPFRCTWRCVANCRHPFRMVIKRECTQAGKVAGLASMQQAPLPCTCFDSKGHRWACAVKFVRVGVKWLPVRVCTPPLAKRIDGLASLLPGNRGGCAPSNYWRNISCTVVKAGRGWAFGDCELGYAFSGSTRGTFKAGQAVTVDGCLDDKGNLLDGGKKYPLRVKAK